MRPDLFGATPCHTDHGKMTASPAFAKTWTARPEAASHSMPLSGNWSHWLPGMTVKFPESACVTSVRKNCTLKLIGQRVFAGQDVTQRGAAVRMEANEHIIVRLANQGLRAADLDVRSHQGKCDPNTFGWSSRQSKAAVRATVLTTLRSRSLPGTPCVFSSSKDSASMPCSNRAISSWSRTPFRCR